MICFSGQTQYYNKGYYSLRLQGKELNNSITLSDRLPQFLSIQVDQTGYACCRVCQQKNVGTSTNSPTPAHYHAMGYWNWATGMAGGSMCMRTQHNICEKQSSGHSCTSVPAHTHARAAQMCTSPPPMWPRSPLPPPPVGLPSRKVWGPFDLKMSFFCSCPYSIEYLPFGDYHGPNSFIKL